MIVSWVTDLDPMTPSGGGLLTDYHRIIEGIRRGHEINIVLPGERMPSYDVAVISTATQFAISDIKALDKTVFFFHDYWPLCRWRLFYPMLEKCRDCFRKPDWVEILQKAELRIWLSPLHRESMLFGVPDLRESKFLLSPSGIPVKKFYDKGEPREGALAIHSGKKFKGYDRFVEWAEGYEGKITLVGEADGPVPSNVKIIPGMPYEDMNDLYNKHEVFVHLPTTPQPFDRTVAEAYLSGCRIIGNRNIGALSYEVFGEGREAVRNFLSRSGMKFWDRIEKVSERYED